MKLYVIRHGQTEYNVENRVCGVTDVPLNKQGIKQAYQTKEKLKNIDVDYIFSSPLTRAKTTANIINEAFNLEINIDKRIQEINFGEFEGVENNEKFKKYKKQNATRYPGGESLFQVVQRVYDFLTELENQYPDKTILIVCHGGIVRVIHSYFNDMTNDELMTWLPENCSIQQYQK